ncbi:nuclear transport factor 2 family protein [Actinocrispum sp. NPDC049592]|uniref:YybH family protein n=1 Tax=Actinocrispum sp. NPDC049592 TaxID=3154835 RepID=UPI00341CB1CF
MPSLPLATEASDHPHVFARAFNSFDLAELDAVYEPDAVLVPSPGTPVTGYDRRAANAKLQSLGRRIEVRPRHVYVSGDIALLIVDWEIAAAGISGTATDVARRGEDGCWRYVIDNPQPVELQPDPALHWQCASTAARGGHPG